MITSITLKFECLLAHSKTMDLSKGRIFVKVYFKLHACM